MKVAHITLIRAVEEAATSIINRNYTEEVRGFSEIVWAPSHVIFHWETGAMIAYKADRIFELVVSLEEDQ